MARKSEGMSERHRKIMEFLTAFQEMNGYSASIREIGDSIKVKSTSLVDYYLEQLVNMGFIERDKRISRSIRILRPVYSTTLANRVGNPGGKTTLRTGIFSEVLTLPVLGRIVAGQPIPVPGSDMAYFDAESSVEIARSLLPAREKISDLFALEVQGDSMIDAMINDGDIVILKSVNEVQNGEMAAIWLIDTDETTLKYFYLENEQVRLQPANPTMKPIYIEDPSRVRIMGKVVMVIRQVHND